jgi:tungstate transport system substrate-binding protein
VCIAVVATIVPVIGMCAMIQITALLCSIILISTAHADERFITLSSTTSTQDSGLFGYILPLFKSATRLSVRVVAVGTGQAFAIGARGDADALLVHDRPGEDKFVADGFGVDRRDVMYNDFVIVRADQRSGAHSWFERCSKGPFANCRH